MPSMTKRITISFNEKDTELINFINSQQNASLSIRLICKKWIAKYGTGDAVDTMVTQSDVDKEMPSLSKFKKQNPISKNTDIQSLSKANSDLNDDNFYDL